MNSVLYNNKLAFILEILKMILNFHQKKYRIFVAERNIEYYPVEGITLIVVFFECAHPPINFIYNTIKISSKMA